jgi:hypothetical protein
MLQLHAGKNYIHWRMRKGCFLFFVAAKGSAIFSPVFGSIGRM